MPLKEPPFGTVTYLSVLAAFLFFLGRPGGRGRRRLFRTFSSLLIHESSARGRPVCVFSQIRSMPSFFQRLSPLHLRGNLFS